MIACLVTIACWYGCSAITWGLVSLHSGLPKTQSDRNGAIIAFFGGPLILLLVCWWLSINRVTRLRVLVRCRRVWDSL